MNKQSYNLKSFWLTEYGCTENYQNATSKMEIFTHAIRKHDQRTAGFPLLCCIHSKMLEIRSSNEASKMINVENKTYFSATVLRISKVETFLK